MRTIRTKVYQFSELSEQAKQKAIEWYRNTDTGDYSASWDWAIDDAKDIGLKIHSLSDHKQNEGQFYLSANEVAQNIFNNHGEGCETYKTAENFMKEWQPVFNEYMTEPENMTELEAKLIDIESDFLNNLLEDYRIMYNHDIDYRNSDESITEMLIINEYEFKADGTRF